jgi:hypothetical protein
VDRADWSEVILVVASGVDVTITMSVLGVIVFSREISSASLSVIAAASI